MLGDDLLDPVGPNQFVEKLQRAGYSNLRNVPLALKREIADDLHANWIFSGTIGKVGDRYTATVSLHAAGDGGNVSDDSYVADDVFDLVDRISADLRKHLEIPKRDRCPTCPSKEYFTSNEAALKPYGQARNLILIDATGPARQRSCNKPSPPIHVHARPARALASLMSSAIVAPRRSCRSRPHSKNNYRLPERAQFTVKADYYGVTAGSRQSLRRHRDVGRALSRGLARAPESRRRPERQESARSK